MIVACVSLQRVGLPWRHRVDQGGRKRRRRSKRGIYGSGSGEVRRSERKEGTEGGREGVDGSESADWVLISCCGGF